MPKVTGRVRIAKILTFIIEKGVFGKLENRFGMLTGDGEMAENIFIFVPNLIGYARIILALLSFYYMPTNHILASSMYVLSGFLDAFDGHAARILNQATKFGAMLDMLTDRCGTMCLLVTLSHFYPQYMFLFQVSMTIDISCHWLHLHTTVLAGRQSHKGQDSNTNPILRIYYSSRAVLFLMCCCCCLSLGCLAEQPRAPQEGHGLDWAFPQILHGVYVVLLAYEVVCGAVFHDVFDSVGCSVAVWTGISNGFIQPLLIAQEGWVVPTSEPGQVDSVFTGKCGFRRVYVRGPCV